MPLTSGTRLGPYEIVAPLGAGGMGEVYRARDPRLGRDVAIKVLPASFSADPDRLRRFEHEARAAGVLNHPNITAVYDIGTHDGAPYVVEELLEGETLRSELAGERLPVRRAIDYALQTARGLAAAHEKGIVHRDLKPENLFVTRDGRLKILDFGLAKLVQKEPEGSSRETSLPTATLGTEPGIMLGTLGYMSPEQVRGRQADARSDIFALGAILYEMLSGRRAFHGDSSADTMSAILREDPPDLSATNQAIAPGLERIVRHCLEKNPERRFHSAHDVALALEALSGSSAASTVAAAPITVRPFPRLLLPVAAGVLVAIAVGVALVLTLRPRPSNAEVVRLSINPPDGATFSVFGIPSTPVLSPDGRNVAYFASDDQGVSSLWIRSLSNSDASRIPPPNARSYPFWSPDSRFLAFAAGGQPWSLKKVPVSGGPPITITDLPSPVSVMASAAWSSRGVILLAGRDGMFTFKETGGPATRFVPVDGASDPALRLFPAFLPDGRHFLYLVRERGENALWVASLDDRKAKRLVSGLDSQGFYVEPGYLLYARGGVVFAQGFEDDRLEFSGEPVPVARDVFQLDIRPRFSASRDALAYLTWRTPATELLWFDRDGKPSGKTPTPEGSQSPELSPDGSRVLVERRNPGGFDRDLWMIDLGRGTALKFTSSPGDDSDPVWSPDGQRIIFYSDRDDRPALYAKSATSEAPEKKLPEIPNVASKIPNDWSRDGRHLLVAGPAGIFAVPAEGPGQPMVMSESGGAARFSPDGRRVAYQSSASGRYEIYVRAFPTGGTWQVSTEGGFRPRWRADGRELFYIAPDRKLMSVAIEPGEQFRASAPHALFQTRISGPLALGIRFNYAVAPDGRFLIVSDTGSARPVSITLVLNWQAELEKK